MGYFGRANSGIIYSGYIAKYMAELCQSVRSRVLFEIGTVIGVRSRHAILDLEKCKLHASLFEHALIKNCAKSFVGNGLVCFEIQNSVQYLTYF